MLQGHSAWGQFLLKGRIRAYDGLFSLTKEYTLGSRGRWLYRGYVISGGSLVGRWRDTHSPIDMNGYEGTFLVRPHSCFLELVADDVLCTADVATSLNESCVV